MRLPFAWVSGSVADCGDSIRAMFGLRAPSRMLEGEDVGLWIGRWAFLRVMDLSRVLGLLGVDGDGAVGCNGVFFMLGEWLV